MFGVSPLTKNYRVSTDRSQSSPCRDKTYAYHSPQEHFADKPILVDWLLVLTLRDFGPHLHCSSVRSLRGMD